MFQKIFLFLLLLGNLYANGSEPSLLNLRYFNDKNSTLSISEIIDTKFEKQISPNFALGYQKGDIWFKFELTNNSDQTTVILSLNESFYEKAELYYFATNKKLLHKSNSLFKPVNDREVASNKLAFELDLPEGAKQTFWLKINGKYSYFGRLSIQSKQAFYAHTFLSMNTVYIFIFGILFTVVIFNLSLYLYVRERVYLYYVSYAFFNLIYMSNISGLLVYLNLQKYIYTLHLSAAFMVGFLTLFSFEYLNTKKYMKRYDKFLKSLSIPFFLFGVLIVISYQPWNQFVNNFTSLICITLIIVSIIVSFKGHLTSKYYLFTMVLYFGFALYFTFMVVGLLEYSNLSRYGFIVASATETIIFSMILSNRYNQLKNDNARFLENEVAKRTQEVKKLLDEKELLIKEIHHRVKNNFHTISGLLWFEEQKDPIHAQKFQNIKNRIKSMSMIHEKLYKAETISDICLKEYLEEIARNLLSDYKHLHIKLEEELENIVLNFEYALALGIILNEVVSNSIKHNQETQQLHISIKLHKKDALILLEISDNGKGFSPQSHSEGIGMSLIESFANTLPMARYSFSSEQGVKFTLELKVNGDKADG